MKLVYSISLPDFPSHYISSTNIRAKYYKKGDKTIPKKLLGVGNIYRAFKVTRKGKKVLVKYLCTPDGVKIVKNEKQVGLAKESAIQGQHLFNTKTDAFGIGKILSCIKEHFQKHYIKPKIDFKYPLYLEFIYKSESKADLDNYRILYEKAIIDSIKVFEYKRADDFKMIKIDNPKGFLPEDSTEYINKISSEYILSNERELILNIWER